MTRRCVYFSRARRSLVLNGVQGYNADHHRVLSSEFVIIDESGVSILRGFITWVWELPNLKPSKAFFLPTKSF